MEIKRDLKKTGTVAFSVPMLDSANRPAVKTGLVLGDFTVFMLFSDAGTGDLSWHSKTPIVNDGTAPAWNEIVCDVNAQGLGVYRFIFNESINPYTKEEGEPIVFIVRATGCDEQRVLIIHADQNQKVDLVSIDGELTAGNNATLNLKKLSIVNTTDNAVEIENNSNAPAVKIENANAGGGALSIEGGSGVSINATNAHGIAVNALVGTGFQVTSKYEALKLESIDSDGLKAIGNGTGSAGINADGSENGLSLSGVFGLRALGTDVGIFARSSGAGAGMQIETAGGANALEAVEIQAIKTNTDYTANNPDDYKASLSGLGTVDANIVSVTSTAVTDVDDFKADVSGIGSDVNVVSVDGTAVTSPDDFKADVSALALESSVDVVSVGVDEVKAVVDSIKNDTDAIVLKLPAGQIGDITLDTVIDGERVEDIVKLFLSRNAGKYVIIRGTGTDEIQFFSQDNSTELMAVAVTENGRERLR